MNDLLFILFALFSSIIKLPSISINKVVISNLLFFLLEQKIFEEIIFINTA